jgi:U4/U6.U5 tri-snRNP-associated protein 1
MPAAPGSLARKTKREERTDGDPSHRQSSSKKPFSSRSSSSRSAGRDDGDSGGGKSAVRDDDADGDGGGGGGETVSMSVAETNKIRISLGLAPLEETPADGGEEKFTDTGERIMMDTDTNSEFVHKPADSWTAKKEQEKLREKLESAKSKREALNKLASVRTLSTPANEAEDDAAQWVNMMRSKEEQKRQAEQRVRHSLFRLLHLF